MLGHLRTREGENLGLFLASGCALCPKCEDGHKKLREVPKDFVANKGVLIRKQKNPFIAPDRNTLLRDGVHCARTLTSNKLELKAKSMLHCKSVTKKSEPPDTHLLLARNKMH